MDKIVTLKKFGRLWLEGETYVLLRPLPFVSEHYANYGGTQFYVASWTADLHKDPNNPGSYFPQAYNPHVVTANENCKYYIDFDREDIPVLIYDGHEMEDIPTEIKAEMRPIEMIVSDDDELPF